MRAQVHLTICSPVDVAHRALPSVGFSGQEYCSGLRFPPPPGDLPTTQGSNLRLLHWQVDFFPTEPPEEAPYLHIYIFICIIE